MSSDSTSKHTFRCQKGLLATDSSPAGQPGPGPSGAATAPISASDRHAAEQQQGPALSAQAATAGHAAAAGAGLATAFPGSAQNIASQAAGAELAVPDHAKKLAKREAKEARRAEKAARKAARLERRTAREQRRRAKQLAAQEGPLTQPPGPLAAPARARMPPGAGLAHMAPFTGLQPAPAPGQPVNQASGAAPQAAIAAGQSAHGRLNMLSEKLHAECAALGQKGAAPQPASGDPQSSGAQAQQAQQASAQAPQKRAASTSDSSSKRLKAATPAATAEPAPGQHAHAAHAVPRAYAHANVAMHAKPPTSTSGLDRLAEAAAPESAKKAKLPQPTVPYKGVHWSREKGKWLAQITVNSRTQHVGYHDDPLEAAKAWDQAFVRYRGTTIGTNFPETAEQGPSVPCPTARVPTSRFKGVSWCKTTSKWRVQVKAFNKDKFIGRFKDEVEAAHAYDQAVIAAKGPKAETNFPQEPGEQPMLA